MSISRVGSAMRSRPRVRESDESGLCASMGLCVFGRNRAELILQSSLEIDRFWVVL